jgi:hypothetical protein
VKTYNDLCKEMSGLVRQKEAPWHAFVPQPIDPQKLFGLDADNDIWQDTGLDGDEDGAVPLWLGSDNVRMGINHRLMLDRCLEEESRLKRERANMQLWLYEEWDVLQRAISANGMLHSPTHTFTNAGHSR